MTLILLGILNSQAAGGEAPAFLSSAPLWLDAADASTISESGGSVSQWDNKGTLENFTQATSSEQPTTGVNTQNGLNVIDFSNNSLVGSTASNWKFMTDGSSYFWAGVIKYGVTADPTSFMQVFSTGTFSLSSVTAAHSYGDLGELDNAFHYIVSAGNGSAVAGIFTETNTITPNTFNITSANLDPDNATASNRLEYFTNGVQGTDTNSSNATPSTSNPETVLTLGAAGNLNFRLSGSIAELIIVNGADATETNRQEVVNYLNGKWSVY